MPLYRDPVVRGAMMMSVKKKRIKSKEEAKKRIDGQGDTLKPESAFETKRLLTI
jgi:hypothetical protein